MSKVKIVRYSLIGLIVAGIGFGLASHYCLREESRDLLSLLPEKRVVSLNHIHQVATRDGVKEWTLDAGSAQFQKADNKTVFKDVSATFFLKNGESVHLNGRAGVLLSDAKDIEVWGDVVVKSGLYELNTDKLRYEHKTRTIFTETPIVIKGNGMEITGQGMTFNLQTERVVVRGRVKTLFENRTL